MSVAKHPIHVVIILSVITLKGDIDVLARVVTLGRLTSVLVRNFFTFLVRKKENLFCHEILSPKIKSRYPLKLLLCNKVRITS